MTKYRLVTAAAVAAWLLIAGFCIALAWIHLEAAAPLIP